LPSEGKAEISQCRAAWVIAFGAGKTHRQSVNGSLTGVVSGPNGTVAGAQPWNMNWDLVPKEELIEYVCDNRAQNMVGK